jgi:hypothetical protein
VVVRQIPVSWNVTLMLLDQQFPVFCKNVMPSSLGVEGSKMNIKREKRVCLLLMAQLLKVRNNGWCLVCILGPQKGL